MKPVNIRCLAVALLMLVSMPVLAADPTRDVRQPDSRTSAYAEISFGISSTKVPLVGFNEKSIEQSTNPVGSLDLSFEGRFQYQGFFVEVIEDSFSNITAGYSVYDNDRGSLELIATELFGALKYSDIHGLESIENRKSDVNLGLRNSYFFDNKLLQLELLTDVADSHNGFVGAVHIGQQIQRRNWNLFALAGIRYFSSGVIDHLFGVSATEATSAIPEYEGKVGMMSSIQLGAVLPLSEHWTFNAQAEYAKFSDSVSDSPLAQGSDMYIGRISVNYILFN